MTKYLTFRIEGYARIPIDRVIFFTPQGDAADPKVVESLITDDILDNINNGDLDFDWLQVYKDEGFSKFELDEINCIESK